MHRKGSTSRTASGPGLTQAEKKGKEYLRTWLRSGVGRNAETSRATGILPASLSKMANLPEYPIGLEYAVLIEVATEGAVPAHILCPSRAEVLAKLLTLRSAKRANA